MSKQPRFQLTSPTLPEHPLQEDLRKVLELEIALQGKISDQGVTWYAIDIAAYKGIAPGTRIARGIVAGLPDNWFHWGGHSGCIELKAKSDMARLSPVQMERISVLRQAGIFAAICNDTWQVLQVLDAWGVPRSRRTRVAA
jgi:hypothetical protein